MTSLCVRLNATPAYKNIGVLETNIRYVIRYLERVDTEHGKAILSVITDNEQNCFKVHLPKRYTHVFTDEDITNYKDGSLAFIYLGKERNAYNLRFVTTDETNNGCDA